MDSLSGNSTNAIQAIFETQSLNATALESAGFFEQIGFDEMQIQAISALVNVSAGK